ncbi:MAG: hypothetical protein ACE5JB_03120 [bacterium]
MQKYLEAIRRRVCSVCIDGIFENGHKFVRCGLPADRTCHIELYLPQVIEVVESLDSPRMDDYIALLNEKVCAMCENSEEGYCALRLKADCALDRYFMLVAEAIEEVQRPRRNLSKNNSDDSLNKHSNDWFMPTPW